MAALKPSGLPIDAALPELLAALQDSPRAVLKAPPGAGKSTVVPLALLEQPWVSGGRLLMLEPRRLAARAVATRMAQTLAEAPGATIGWRMRQDTKVSRATRIEVVTEGVLTRMLQQDPALEGVAAVIFDEFHERSLQADLGLALVLDAQANLRPDLKLLVMSATLDTGALSQRLGNAPVVTAEGRTFPVEVFYTGRGAPVLPGPPVAGQESLETLVLRAVLQALREQQGDALVFLPGAREIRRLQSMLEGADTGAGVRVLPLYGELAAADQDAALQPAAPGTRKVVLATNIAETSLTIQGIRIVVDAGVERRSTFDPVTGMSRLETGRISRASAEQRAGRAGRVQSGACFRVWSEGAQRSLAAFGTPEILDTDLTGLALELASWGVIDANTLTFLDQPPAAQLASARDLLRLLGAVDGSGRITPHGRKMAALGTHPRLAHMLLKARPLGLARLAADLAALLSERDLLRSSRGRDTDVHSRLKVLRGQSDAEVDRGALQRARRMASDLLRQSNAGNAESAETEDREGLLLAFAYPDRIALRRDAGEGRYLLANGRGAVFPDAQALRSKELVVAVDLDDRDRDARILLAAALDRDDVEEHFADALENQEEVKWSEREQAVSARRVLRLGALELESKPLREVPQEAALSAMLQGLRQLGIAALPWDEDARLLQARLEFVRRHLALDSEDRPVDVAGAPWPAVDDDSLLARLEDWLSPWLGDITRRSHLTRLPLQQALLGLLSHEQQRKLSDLAPTHLTVPTGSHVRIDYQDELAPVVAVRIQEVFGLLTTPRIAGGRVAVTFKLLSPAHRPLQITRDLAGFWRGSYAEVRKDMRGRYPRHYWPEDPAVAEPTRRAKPRGT